MGLGNNRDYKTTDRAARKVLLRHASIMDDLVTDGMDRDAASSLSLRMVQNKDLLKEVYNEIARHKMEQVRHETTMAELNQPKPR